MRELVLGTAPGLPEALVDQIVDRAEGVPLYAVETVRMLLGSRPLERRDGQMVAIGEVEALEIPPTLHALAAARLDALGEYERKLVQDAAVLGKTFQVTAWLRSAGSRSAQLEPLVGRARGVKEIFSADEDPRSPDQGQYGFVQELLRTVAYETLGRRDRKARHLATARHLESLPVADELIEVIAAHQLDAYRAMPDDGDDCGRARESLLRAAQRAASLAAKAEAMRLVLQAVELTDSDRDRAELQQRAAQLALSAGLVEECEALAGEAITLLEAGGDPPPAAAHVVRAEARFLLQRTDEVMARWPPFRRAERTARIACQDRDARGDGRTLGLHPAPRRKEPPCLFDLGQQRRRQGLGGTCRHGQVRRLVCALPLARFSDGLAQLTRANRGERAPPPNPSEQQSVVAHLLADLAERLLLELTDALARQVVLVADLLERELVLVVEAEAPADDARLDGRERRRAGAAPRRSTCGWRGGRTARARSLPGGSR